MLERSQFVSSGKVNTTAVRSAVDGTRRMVRYSDMLCLHPVIVLQYVWTGCWLFRFEALASKKCIAAGSLVNCAVVPSLVRMLLQNADVGSPVILSLLYLAVTLPGGN
jgi:hypothetical protein